MKHGLHYVAALIHNIFTARVRSTMGGYVFIGMCLFRGVLLPLVPGSFSGSYTRSFPGATPSPFTGHVQSPVPGLAWGYPIQDRTEGIPRQDKGTPPPIGQRTTLWTGQGVSAPWRREQVKHAAGGMSLAVTQKDFLDKN